MAKDKDYKSIATKFVEYIKGLNILQQFQDSFSEKEPLGLLHKEIMNEKAKDPSLLSSYYKLVTLKSAVESGNIDMIKNSRDNWIADFETKSKKPSRSLKTFWQKIKIKLSNTLLNWTRNKNPNVPATNNIEAHTKVLAPQGIIPPAPPLPTAKSNLIVNSTLKKTQNTQKSFQSELSKAIQQRKNKQNLTNDTAPGIAPPLLPSARPKQTAKLTTPKKPQNTVPVSRNDMLSELLAKTKHKREAETPEASVVNSATREQPKQAKKEIAPQVQVNKPTQGIAPPPPPLPQAPSVNLQPAAKKVNTDPKPRNQNSQNTSAHTDLFEQIRKAGGKNLSKNHQNYTYIKTAKNNISDPKLDDVLAKAMQGKANIQSLNNPQVTKLLDNKTEQERLNILYSAFVDKNEALIKDLRSYKVNVAISNDDDWDTLEEATTQVTTTNIFTDKQYNEVKQAALETAQRMERGEDLISASPVNKTTSQEVTPTTKSKVMNPVPAPAKQISNSKKSPLVAGGADGVIPPPPPVKSYAPPHAKTLLESIRNQDSIKLKPVVKISESFNTENFTYLNENKSDLQEGTNAVAASLKTRRLSINGNKELKKEFKTLDDKAKLNKLYSYIIDNDQAKIKAFLDYDSDSNNEVFGKENLKKIAKDIVSVANKNPKSTVQIHNGLKYFADQTDLDISNIEKKSLSHAEQLQQQRESSTQTRRIN